MIEATYTNSLFEEPWWLDIVAPGQWSETYVKEGDEVIGRMVYCCDGHSIYMPKLTPTLGPWIRDDIRQKSNGNTQLGKQKDVIKNLIEQLPKVKNFHMCFDSSNDYVLPYRWLGYRYEPSFSYVLDDLSDIDKVFNSFHKQLKKNIRKSEDYCQISEDNDPEILINVMDRTYENQGRRNPISHKLVKTIVEKASINKRGKMFTARDEDGNVQVSAFMVYDHRRAYALISGSDPKYRGSGSKSLIYWKQIQYASKHSKIFDFEGSNIEGIENIIRQFGGDRIVNYEVIKKTYARECFEVLKPRIKHLIGYKN